MNNHEEQIELQACQWLIIVAMLAVVLVIITTMGGN